MHRDTRFDFRTAAIGAQALFVVAIDSIGLAQSSRVHGNDRLRFAPSVALVPTPSGTDAVIGLSGTS